MSIFCIVNLRTEVNAYEKNIISRFMPETGTDFTFDGRTTWKDTLIRGLGLREGDWNP